jgi:hypothetical protein
MIRTVCGLVLLAALGSSVAPLAQSIDPTIAVVVEPAATCKPKITITLPTSEATLTTPTETFDLGGTVQRGTCGSPIATISWTNLDTLAEGEATGTIEPTWLIPAATGGVVGDIAFDQFTGAGTTCDITSPACHSINLGSAWSTLSGSNSTSYARLLNGEGSVGPSASDTASGQILAVEITPVSALSGGDFEITFDLAVISGTTSFGGIFFGGSNVNNACVLGAVSAAANPDLFLVSRSGGTPTNIAAPINAGPNSGYVYRLVKVGSNLTVYQNGVQVMTGTSACNFGSKAGLIFGDVTGAGFDVSTSVRISSFKLTDSGTGVSGVVLQNGLNRLLVTALDADGHIATAQLNVTKAGVGDMELPTITITSPATGGTYTTQTAAVTVAGTTSDNVGTIEVRYTCTGATTLSGTAVLSLPSWTVNLTVNGGTTDCDFIAKDAALNDSLTAELSITLPTADVTSPVLTISTNGGANFPVTSSPVTLNGLCTDASGATGVTFSTDRGQTGAATGSFPGPSVSWGAVVTVLSGANVITLTCRDAANNNTGTAVKQITVTLNLPLQILSGSSLNGVSGVAGSALISGAGGDGSYIWTNNGAGTTLNDADADCAGTAVATVSNQASITWNHTGAGVCSWVLKLDDGVASPITQAMTLTFVDPATGPEAYWTNIIKASPAWWKGYSLTPPGTGHPCLTTVADGCGDPDWDNQLASTGAFTGGSSTGVPMSVTYNFAGDTHPDKQNGAKLTIPAFQSIEHTGLLTLTSGIDASQLTFTATQNGSSLPETAYNVGGAHIRLGTGEVMRLKSPSCPTQTSTNCAYAAATNTFTIDTGGRGALGTMATTHAAGTKIRLNNNSLERQPFLPIGTADGFTYLLTFDAWFTPSYVGSGQQNQKFVNLRRSSGLILQANRADAPASSTCPGGAASTMPAGYNSNVSPGYFNFRAFNHTIGTLNSGAPANWLDSDGNTFGPGTTADQPLCPASGTFAYAVNTRTRFWIRIQQRANDYDIVDAWVADENRDAVQVNTSNLISVGLSLDPQLQTIGFLQIEQNTSLALFARNLTLCTVSTNTGCDLVTYMKNVGILRVAGVAAGSELSNAMMTSTYLVKPTR